MQNQPLQEEPVGSPGPGGPVPGYPELPPAPSSIADTGLDIGILASLALKTIYYANYIDETTLGERIALPFTVTNELLKFLQQQSLCEVTGATERALGRYRYSLTSRGVERAVEALEISGYVGPAPVPLDDYLEQVARQSVQKIDIPASDVEHGIEHLVLPDETRKLIGQAITSKRATLLYGASGNGKTSAALGLAEALHDYILIPHALEVMREVIQLYDSAAHHAAEAPPAREVGGGGPPDRRWLVIKRPAVFVAGELAATHLELMLDQVHKTYDAPVQLKANGGLLIIDDFGRQRLDANYLLNRWVTPLERGVDHLSLHSGARFEVPFDAVPIFVSNRPPAELADDAFLRRIRYKIEIPSPNDALFCEILRRECARNEVAYDDGAARYLIDTYFRNGQDLRGCHPRDLVEMIADAAHYRGTERALTPSTVDEACAQYFARRK